MISYQNLYSLGQLPNDIVGDMQKFRRVDKTGFNATDSVDTRFFKLLFYFYNDNSSRINDASIDFFNGGESGLLAPTWLDNVDGDYYKYNSAWAFLKNNFEEERADALKTFIGLLSNISAESPWYFQKITGVDEALSRDNWKITDERKKISIECLSDPIDHRIESLLSLYRSIVWSHARKCEILPSNLRKFDMGLFIFSGLTKYLHYGPGTGPKLLSGVTSSVHQDIAGEWAQILNNNPRENLDVGRANYKYIEFHNCEIDLDSIKSGFGDINNETGFKQTFTIDIYFDDCYENEYNPFIMKTFGDFFLWDLWESSRTETGDVAKDPDSLSQIISDINDPSKHVGLQEDLKTMLGESGKRSEIVSSEQHPSFGKLTPNLYNTVDDSLDPFKKIGDNIKYATRSIVNGIKNTAINSITGGLGNIYGNGFGIRGAIDSVSDEVNKQIKSLTNKITGNINDSIIGASRNLTSAATYPVLGTINTSSTISDTVIQSADNLLSKPVLGTTKAIENIAKRTTDLGYSYVNEAGQYIVNESDDLGNIAYNTQANLPNTIGKNRLNSSNLGNIYD